MLDGNGAEPNAANQRGPSQRHCAPVEDRQTTKQFPRRRRRVDRTRSAVEEARRMVGVRMREDDRGRSNSMQTTQPVRAAVDHDAGIILLDKQRAVTSMPA